MLQSDSIIHTVLSILTKRDFITEQTSKYLQQYFNFFNSFANLGLQQCLHLMRCDVPLTLMQFAMDELATTASGINLSAILSSSSSITSSSFSLNYSKLTTAQNQNTTNNNSNGCSSQYADLSRLYCCVSTLLRCYDVSSYCTTLQQHAASSELSPNASKVIPPNPFSHQNELKQLQEVSSEPLASHTPIRLPAKMEDLLFKASSYFKKLLEEAPSADETVNLMKFLCWENMSFSLMLLNELLWMAAYHYSYELKPHLEMLYHVLSVSDSWQCKRILCALQGIAEREGVFEIIAKSQNHYQKRAYQLIKMLVQLFSTCEPAIELLNKDDDLKRKWKQSRNWFFNEMEKVTFI